MSYPGAVAPKPISNDEIVFKVKKIINWGSYYLGLWQSFLVILLKVLS